MSAELWIDHLRHKAAFARSILSPVGVVAHHFVARSLCVIHEGIVMLRHWCYVATARNGTERQACEAKRSKIIIGTRK